MSVNQVVPFRFTNANSNPAMQSVAKRVKCQGGRHSPDQSPTEIVGIGITKIYNDNTT